MFLKKKRKFDYTEMINNKPLQKWDKPLIKPKLQAIINKITPPIQKIETNTFIMPKTNDEWYQFHKNNEDNMKKAYSSKEGYYHDNNKLYVAGTRNMVDVGDWYRIPLGTFRNSNIYKNVEPYFKNHPEIDTLIGHSAGSSGIYELERNFPERKVKTIGYNSPVIERGGSNPMNWINDDDKAMRFSSAWDPVSMLDYNSRVTYKTPQINTELVKNIAKSYTNPNIKNVIDTIKSGFSTDPLMGQHSMTGTYSNPSSVSDFIKTGVDAVVAGNTLGAAIL